MQCDVPDIGREAVSFPVTQHDSNQPAGKRGWQKRIAAFGYAGRGVWRLVCTQWNARFHALATVGAISLGVAFRIERLEWLILLLTIGLVWVAEAVNTAIEFALDRAAPERHPLVRDAKDIAAGGVLCAAVVALAVGCVIFGPRIFHG